MTDKSDAINDPFIPIVSFQMPYNELLLQGKMNLEGFPTKSLSDKAVSALKLPEGQSYVQVLLYTSTKWHNAVVEAHGLKTSADTWTSFAKRLQARHIVACGLAALGYFRWEEAQEMISLYGAGKNVGVSPYPNKLRFTSLHRLENPVPFDWSANGGSNFGTPLRIEKANSAAWKQVREQLPMA
jgi:hypothetical protein